jgi:hypothetical protein
MRRGEKFKGICWRDEWVRYGMGKARAKATAIAKDKSKSNSNSNSKDKFRDPSLRSG